MVWFGILFTLNGTGVLFVTTDSDDEPVAKVVPAKGNAKKAKMTVSAKVAEDSDDDSDEESEEESKPGIF